MPESVYYFQRDAPLAAYISWLKVVWTETVWTETVWTAKPENAKNVAKRKWPIVTLGVLAFTLTANFVQYRDGAGTVQNAFRKKPWVAFLYPLKLLGLDTLRDDMVNGLLSLFITFVCLGTVEISYLSNGKVLFFLLVDIMFAIGQWSFLTSFCRGEMYSSIDLMHDSYCCGSFMMMASIGLVLMCVRSRIGSGSGPVGQKINWPRLFMTFVIAIVWLLTILNDYYYHFHYDPESTRTCESFTWHAMSFLFGVVCGAVFTVDV